MRVQAVVVPPPGAVDGALAILDDIFHPELVEAPKRGVLGRFRKPQPASGPPEASWTPNAPDAVFVRVGKFGNVTLTDTQRLVRALVAAAPSWGTPLVRVTAIHVGETEPFAVTARLEGDLDGLVAIFRNVLGVAKQESFFLDRRSFRTEVLLGSVSVPAGAMVPESLPGAVIPVDGPEWTVSHLHLLQMSHAGTNTVLEQMAAIPLGRRANVRVALSA